MSRHAPSCTGARALAIACVASAATLVSACASSQLRRSDNPADWVVAAAALKADSSLLNNQKTLFQAAMLYSLPNRGSYDPAKARALFERLLSQFPSTSVRQIAVDQLAMLYELQRVGNAAVAKQQDLQARIAILERDSVTLRRSIDSVATQLRAEQDQSAVLRKVTTRLEGDLQDRETQLAALHDELNHLKAIDLRPPIRAQNGDTALRKRPRPE